MAIACGAQHEIARGGVLTADLWEADMLCGCLGDKPKDVCTNRRYYF